MILLFFSVLQILVYKCDSGAGKDHSFTDILKLLLDPYILIVAGE